MSKLSRIIILLAVLVLVGGGVFLATWDIPAPASNVVKVLPNDRFEN